MENKKVLIIVESPTKATTIKKFLPKNYTVLASMGHIRELDRTNEAINIDKDFKAKYKVIASKRDIIKKMQKSLETADLLLLATDEDREGESISWHLVDVLKPKQKYGVDYKRMVFHEITEKAIKDALNNQRDINLDLVQAQEARRLLDRLYGFNVSELLWKKLSKYSLSAGRVQSPGLRLLVDKEKQRLNYKTSPYCEIKATLNKDSESFTATLLEYDGKRIATSKDFDITGMLKAKSVLLLDESLANNIVSKADEFKVVSVDKSDRLTQPPIPFTTSTLQMEANRKLRYTGRETMRIAQKLYEKGYITYMRTDSPFLSNEGTKAARNKVSNLFGDEYLSEKTRYFKAKSSNAQEAHEAIRPSGVNFKTPEQSKLEGKEKTLYTMIYKRTLACQMKPSVKINTVAKIESEKGLYTANGTTIKFPGYLKAYIDGIDDDEEKDKDALPLLNEKDILDKENIEVISKTSKAPSRFSEATLVKELEKLGIGRPSTYATISSTLKDRIYIVEEKKQLIPTFTGFAVSDFINNKLAYLVDYKFTQRMEDELDEIAGGKKEAKTFLNEFYLGDNGLQANVDAIRKTKVSKDDKSDKIIHLPQIDSDKYNVVFGPKGIYAQYLCQEDNELKNISIPKTYYPYSISNDIIEDLIKTRVDGPQVLGTKDGKNLYLLQGTYGYFWQLGEKDDEDCTRVSLPKKIKPETATFEDAEFYLSLPKVLGTKDDKEILLQIGKYGAYITYDGQNTSIGRTTDPKTFSLEQALDLIESSKSKAAKKNFEENLYDYEGNMFVIKQGPYGIYVKYDKFNLPLPEQYKGDLEQARKLPLETAIELLEAKKAAPKKKRRFKKK